MYSQSLFSILVINVVFEGLYTQTNASITAVCCNKCNPASNRYVIPISQCHTFYIPISKKNQGYCDKVKQALKFCAALTLIYWASGSSSSSSSSSAASPSGPGRSATRLKRAISCSVWWSAFVTSAWYLTNN